MIGERAGVVFAPQVTNPNWEYASWLPESFYKIRNHRDKPYMAKEVPVEVQHKRFLHFVMHNSLATAELLFIGMCLFIYPATNAALLGFFLGVFYWSTGSPQLFMRFNLPHGLVEIPLGIYAAALGQTSGWRWLSAGAGRRWPQFKLEAAANARAALVLFPLVVIAALLEAYVTKR